MVKANFLMSRVSFEVYIICLYNLIKRFKDVVRLTLLMNVSKQVCLKQNLNRNLVAYLCKPTVNYLFENLGHWANIAFKKRYAQIITDVPHC